MNVLRGTTECCCIRISPMQLKFEVCPEVLDQIHVRGIWRPIVHDSESMFCHCAVEESFGFFACVRPSIILLQCDTDYTVICKSIKIWKEIVMEDGCIYIPGNRTRNGDNWTQFIAGKASPNHLIYISVS